MLHGDLYIRRCSAAIFTDVAHIRQSWLNELFKTDCRHLISKSCVASNNERLKSSISVYLKKRGPLFTIEPICKSKIYLVVLGTASRIKSLSVIGTWRKNWTDVKINFTIPPFIWDEIGSKLDYAPTIMRLNELIFINFKSGFLQKTKKI